MTQQSAERTHLLTGSEKELREWLVQYPGGSEKWFLIKAGFRRSYELGRKDGVIAFSSKTVEKDEHELEIAFLTQDEFDVLLEYSTTLPTGTTIGKTWRRQIYAGPNKGQWWLGEYIEDPDPKLVGIVWKRINLKGDPK